MSHFSSEALEPRRLLASVLLTVSSTADDNSSETLRDAIIRANALPANTTARIVFDFFGANNTLQTIKLASFLPTITAQVDIEGTTDAKGNPLIQLDGINAGLSTNGLTFDRSTPGNTHHSQVSGLIIDRFSGNGIEIEGSSGLTDVFGCRIGTNPTGKFGRGNGGDGILVTSPNNQIGLAGAGPAYQNLISGNVTNGVELGSGGINNIVQNCLIGTDVTGKLAVGNTGQGILIEDAANTIGGSRANQGNVISGNGGDGIITQITAPDTEILGNKIGINSAGTAAIPNALNGIENGGATRLSIGDGTAAGRNIISGNVGAGILMGNSTNCQIDNNFIGTDVTGTKNVGNADKGVLFLSGNTESLTDSVIGGSGFQGVLINGDAFSIDVLNCEIGVGVNKKTAIPNAGNGIETNEGTFCTFEENTIAHNGFNGIEIEGTSQNLIQYNSIFSNGHLGIKLGADTNTPLPNHIGAATGPNDDLNYPVITSATITGAGTSRVQGTFNTTANTAFSIQLFTNGAADPSGFGEGQNYIATINNVTDGSGNATFDITIPQNFTFGQFITATASTNTGTNDETSEFSAAVGVKGASVTGQVFNDANGNGKKDSGETGLAGRIVFVDSGSGVFDSSELFGKTDSNGNYRIFGAKPGKNRVRLAGNAGFKQTFPSPSAAFQDVTVTANGVTKGVLFGQEKSTAIAAALAIDAGSTTAYVDLGGQKFNIDTQQQQFDAAAPFSVSGTDDDPLYYVFVEHGKISYSYNVPNGRYNLKLFFVDPTSTAAGQRKFNVSVNGTQVLKNFDIFATAGAVKRALTKSLSVKIINGKLNLTLQGTTGLAILSAFELIPS